MSIDTLTDFVEKAPHTPQSAWDYSDVRTLAALPAPDVLFGDDKPMLEGDQKRLWHRWFVEALASPHLLAADSTIGKLEILSRVSRRVEAMYRDTDKDRRDVLSDLLADRIYDEVVRLRTPNPRDFASKATKLALIGGTTARCYLCGYAFSQEAQDAFLRVKGRNPVPLPQLVDVLRPRGLKPRDIGIEVEHIVPVALGGSGQSNLRLACGWCNMHKSARVSLYEADFLPPRTRPFHIGPHKLHELPHPFWTVRLLALKGKCQYIDGCPHTAATSELFIGLRDWGGSPNPTNLMVHCAQHDPYPVERLMDSSDARSLWAERKR